MPPKQDEEVHEEPAVSVEVAIPSNPTPPAPPIPSGDVTQDDGQKNVKKWYQSTPLRGVVGALLLVALGVFLIQSKTVELSKAPVKQFTHVYTFVPEKLSKSAQIPISLPDGIDELSAQANITFDPKVKGEWVVEDIPNTLVFQPKEPLTEKVYYRVDMDAPGAQMSGDFYVDADPVVEAVFPANGSEAHESSEITIVFNRPMVPLTTLTELESTEIPITITPETRGRFKWVSSRTLQFIPESTLRPSSEYTIVVKEGLTSVDGLSVLPFTHVFTTRALRYERIPDGVVGYRSPAVIVFNQDVDLKKTSGQIRVQDSEGKDVSIEVAYGETVVYDWESRVYTTKENKAALNVYSAHDTHGREGFWDFDSTYTLTIRGAETIEGTTPLAEERVSSFITPNIVESVTALSLRTNHARPDFFDPEGTLTVRFYDEIDIDKLDYDVRGKKSVAYGERCKEDAEGNEIWKGNECEKESDFHTLIFGFEREKLPIDTTFTLALERVYTKDGSRINQDAYTIDLRTYPPFVLKKTDPDTGNTNAAVNGITVCTTVPLRELGEEESLKSYVSTGGYIVYGRWQGSMYVDPTNTWYTGPCTRGDFETVIHYGLLPQTAYTVSLTLTDAFGQTAQAERSFTTKSPEEHYTRLHNLQQAYNVTRPGRTKLTYAAENLESINLHICKMSPEAFLGRTIRSYSSTESPSDGECLQVVRDTITLPPRYWVNNYFQVDIANYFGDARGHYVVTLGSPLYVTEVYNYGTGGSTKQPMYDRTLVSVTNLAVGKKEIERYEERGWSRSENPQRSTLQTKVLQNASNLYWVTDSQTLGGITGASVTQYTGRQDTSLTMRSVGVTDQSGIAHLKIDSQVMGAVIRNGADSAIVTDWADQLGYAGASEDASRTYLYTDRPIYRPGQTVYVRGIDRIGFDGSYEPTVGEKVPFAVYDARDAKIYDTTLTMSRYGTFNTSFELPNDAPLGVYRMEAFGQSSFVSVEEYVPAAFKIESQSGKDEYISGDTIALEVQADYYFGVPLDQGTVSYSVTAQDYYFDRYTDEYFNFGSSWYYCYSCGYGDQFLFRGEEKLSDKGHATIRRMIDLTEYFKDDEKKGSKLITISYTVKDRNGRSVSSARTFVVHQSDFYLGLQTSEYYTEKNKPITLRVKSVDTTGVPIAKDDITRSVYKIDWETYKRQEVDGGFYYRSEQKRTRVSEESIQTDRDGNWSGTVTLSENGEYEIVVSAKDDRGSVVTTTSHLYIYGGGTVYIPPNNNYELDLEMTTGNLKVGDMASILIKSPYERAKVLVTAERGTVYDYWILDVQGGLYKHSFPIKESYAPNVVLSALLLSPDPEVKFGSVWFPIESDKNKLSVEVTSDKTGYLPGEAVTLSVRTTDVSGTPVSAEVSLAVADLSVLALRGNPKKNPYTFFYDGFPLAVSTASNIKNILYEAEIPLGTKGGDGGNPDDLAKKQRGVFKDTAYWSATVVTDRDGKGTVTFVLPDNLTTWQIESLAVTEDTKLGVNYNEFTTKKELMAIPLKPRFIVPGDTFSLGAHVFNQSDKDETIAVSLESDTLTFTDESSTEVRVGPGESTSVFFEVVAPKTIREGVHTFVFTAKSSTGVDSVKQEIPITKNTVYETTATAHFTKDDVATEYLYIPSEVVSDEGGLTINANATLAIFMEDALTYMAQYPYGCSEQIASALSTIAMVKRALEVPGVEGSLTTIKDMYGVEHTVDEVVAAGLLRIYETQTQDGGITYYKGLRPNLNLSIRIALALDALRDAGFAVSDEVLKNLIAYIEREANSEYQREPYFMANTVILAEYVLRTVGGKTETVLTEKVKSLITLENLTEKLSSESLGYLAILTVDGFGAWDKKQVYDALMNRVNIDGRGAYLRTLDSTPYAFYGYYETPIANTALLLRAFIAHKDEHPELGNVLRWLLKSRDRDGVWGGTQNTFAVITALIEYLEWQHETEAKFTLKGILDGVEIFSHQFNPQNVFKTFTKFVPMQELTPEKLLPLQFERTSETEKPTNFYYDMALRYYLPAESIPPRDEGITITRALYRLAGEAESEPVSTARVGDVVRGTIRLTIPEGYTDVAIEDFIPAGFELINRDLDTEDTTLGDTEENGGEYYNDFYGAETAVPVERSLFTRAFDHVRALFGEDIQVAQVSNWSAAPYNDGSGRAMKLRPTHAELHDDRVFLFVESLSPGVYEYEYYLRALVPGVFQHMPAKAEELYFPEIFGRTDGSIFTITEAE